MLALTMYFFLATACTDASEIVTCNFDQSLAPDQTSFELKANCTIPPESKLYLGNCAWELVRSTANLDSDEYLVPAQFSISQQANTDCGCVTGIVDQYYEQYCAIYLSLGQTVQILHFGTALSKWERGFSSGTFVTLDVFFEVVEAPEVASLPVSMNLFESDFVTAVDPWKPMVLGQLLYISVDLELVGSGILDISRVAVCNLADLQAPGILCGDLFVLRTQPTETFEHLQTQLVVALNLPFAVDGMWYCHVTGTLNPVSRRRLLQLEQEDAAVGFSATAPIIVEPSAPVEPAVSGVGSSDSRMSPEILVLVLALRIFNV